MNLLSPKNFKNNSISMPNRRSSNLLIANSKGDKKGSFIKQNEFEKVNININDNSHSLLNKAFKKK
jgi:hypothetical protein